MSGIGSGSRGAVLAVYLCRGPGDTDRSVKGEPSNGHSDFPPLERLRRHHRPFPRSPLIYLAAIAKATNISANMVALISTA